MVRLNGQNSNRGMSWIGASSPANPLRNAIETIVVPDMSNEIATTENAVTQIFPTIVLV